MNAPLLEAEALALDAGSRRLLQGLDLRIRPGEFWCLLGPNGSGKSTLLHALAGLRPAQGGQLRLGGRPLGQWNPVEAARQRGLLPQLLHDAFACPVLDVVLTGRHPHLPRWGWEGDSDLRLARAALAAVDLPGFEDRDVLGLSGGERQRVGIAALLAQDPRLLMLDEPLAHLDLRHQVQVLQHLRALVDAAAAPRAVILSLHDLHLAHRFATHALLLGPAGPRLGPVDEVMDGINLSAAFGHPVQRVSAGGRTLFLAG